jgi:hypothetical protein
MGGLALVAGPDHSPESAMTARSSTQAECEIVDGMPELMTPSQVVEKSNG